MDGNVTQIHKMILDDRKMKSTEQNLSLRFGIQTTPSGLYDYTMNRIQSVERRSDNLTCGIYILGSHRIIFFRTF